MVTDRSWQIITDNNRTNIFSITTILDFRVENTSVGWARALSTRWRNGCYQPYCQNWNPWRIQGWPENGNDNAALVDLKPLWISGCGLERVVAIYFQTSTELPIWKRTRHVMRLWKSEKHLITQKSITKPYEATLDDIEWSMTWSRTRSRRRLEWCMPESKIGKHGPGMESWHQHNVEMFLRETRASKRHCQRCTNDHQLHWTWTCKKYAADWWSGTFMEGILIGRCLSCFLVRFYVPQFDREHA